MAHAVRINASDVGRLSISDDINTYKPDGLRPGPYIFCDINTERSESVYNNNVTLHIQSAEIVRFLPLDQVIDKPITYRAVFAIVFGSDGRMDGRAGRNAFGAS